jgi:hypothetical protein
MSGSILDVAEKLKNKIVHVLDTISMLTTSPEGGRSPG